ncbi:MAG: superoxide dismutase [Gammaproteobacteria bacterium RIFCSPHIGHO2_12_FULL_45_9]|nr:MAG: superoxide dismutase [Gammaproteobacteria bacterium RIFCSPHIGHO2_12_FULL_45_9]
MAFTLPPLPFAQDALEPFMSAETLSFHYGKHHQAYVNKLNTLIPGTEFEHATLETMMQKAHGAIFNNAAQVWNHTFFWHCLKPQGGGEPTGALADAINKQWGSFATFKDVFTQAALNQFGSGWAWLVKQTDGSLNVLSTSNAGNPFTEGKTPLLTCDVWEHAYYIDTRNDRAQYVERFFSLIHWDFVSANFAAA